MGNLGEGSVTNGFTSAERAPGSRVRRRPPPRPAPVTGACPAGQCKSAQQITVPEVKFTDKKYFN